MTVISFAPADHELEIVRGDSVPPITIPLVDEDGSPLVMSAYDVTAEVIGPDGATVPAMFDKAAGAVRYWMTPAQSAQVQPDSQWCVQLATPDLTDVRTVIYGRVKLIVK